MTRARCVYFAYGSNLHPVRLAERVPSARLMGCSVLKYHRLCFGKRGMDGSGKCTVAGSSAKDAHVPGVLYEMSQADLPSLDRAEGPDYVRFDMDFEFAGGQVRAFLYQARQMLPADCLPPFDWYLDLVLAGARYHGMPRGHLARLRRVRAVADPDPARARAMANLLRRLSVA